VKAGFAYRGLDVIDRQGRLRLEIAMPRLAGLRYPAALGIEHDEFLRILERIARARGVRLHRASEVVKQERRGHLAVLHLASGETVSCDLVVLASGSRSPLRNAWFRHAGATRDTGDAGQLWWHALVPRPLALHRASLYVGGAGCRVMLVPVRTDLAGLAFVEPFQSANENSGVSACAHLREALQEFPPEVQAVARQLHDDTPVTLRPVYSALLPEPWHHEQVIAVGNAAHAMPPHFGQAAAQAVEDAGVLFELLASPCDGAELARRFTARRFPRARQVHEIASTAARWDLEPESSTDLRELSERLSRLVAEPA
jgi:2-polyprenyl-6-methoxyphenol hydroxylase-like FAD-dependent oxidoreductase